MRIGAVMIFISSLVPAAVAHDASFVQPNSITPQLSKPRLQSRCKDFKSTSFAESIDRSVDIAMEPQVPFNEWMRKALRVNGQATEWVRLMSHRMCPFSQKLLHKKMKKEDVIFAKTFIAQYNKLFEKRDVEED